MSKQHLDHAKRIVQELLSGCASPSILLEDAATQSIWEGLNKINSDLQLIETPDDLGIEKRCDFDERVSLQNAICLRDVEISGLKQVVAEQEMDLEKCRDKSLRQELAYQKEIIKLYKRINDDD